MLHEFGFKKSYRFFKILLSKYSLYQNTYNNLSYDILKRWIHTFEEKLNDRCFCWFPAVIFVPLKGTPTWRLFTKLYKFGYNAFPNISHMKYRTDPILGEAFCISLVIFFSFPRFWTFCIDWFASSLLLMAVTMKTETQQCILVTHHQ